jgi:hypothetical protein
MVRTVKILVRYIEPPEVILVYEFCFKVTLLQSGSGRTSKLTFKVGKLKTVKAYLDSLNGMV